MRGGSQPPRPPRQRLALSILCGAFFVDVSGSTSVFAASGRMTSDLGLSSFALEWTINATTLLGGSLLVVGAAASDRIGKRRAFMLGLLALAASACGCGVAPNAAVLIASRAGQGIAGALLLPAALSLLTATFAEGPARAKALAAWSAIGGVGATAGLLVGGVLTTTLGWRSVFLVMVPLCLAMLSLTRHALPDEPATRVEGSTPVVSLAVFATGTALVIYAVTNVPVHGWWAAPTTGPGAAGVAALVVFVAVQSRSRDPLFPPRLVRSSSVVAGNATLFTAGASVDGMLIALALLLQQARGYSAFSYAGIAAVMTVCSVGAAWLAQRALNVARPRHVATGGLAVLAGGSLILGLATHQRSGPVAVVAAMSVFGLGMGLAFVAGSVASLDVQDEADGSIAAAIQNLSFAMGSAFGIAVASSVAAAAGGFGAEAVATAAPVSLVTGCRAAFYTVAALACIGTALVAAVGRSGGR